MAIQPDAEKIKRNFGLISQGYDRANDVMTAGLLRKWRARLVTLSGASPGLNVLDTATGTGEPVSKMRTPPPGLTTRESS